MRATRAPRERSALTRRAALAARWLLVTIAVLVAGAHPPVEAQTSTTTAATPRGPTATLVLQPGSTTTVGPGGNIVVRLRATGARPAPTALELATTLHQRITTRADVEATAGAERLRGTVLAPVATPLSVVPVDADGAMTLTIPAVLPGRAKPLPAGVYPLEIELRLADEGDTVARLVVHIISTAADGSASVGPVPQLVLALPVGTGPGVPAGLTLSSLAASLQRHPRLPIAFAPTPQTIDATREGAGAGGTAPVTGATNPLGLAALNGRATVQRTYVPVAGSMPVDGGPASFGTELAVGRSVVESALGVAPDRTEWIADDSVGASQLDRLIDDGLTTLMVRTAELAATTEPPSTRRSARPTTTVRATVEVAGGAHILEGRPGVKVLVADSALSSVLGDAGPAEQGPLLANRFLAQLVAARDEAAVAPGIGGAVNVGPVILAMADRRSAPSGAFLDALLDGLGTDAIASLVDAHTPRAAGGEVRVPLDTLGGSPDLRRANRSVAAHEDVFGMGLTGAESSGVAAGGPTTPPGDPAPASTTAPAQSPLPNVPTSNDPSDRALVRSLLTAPSLDLDGTERTRRLAAVARTADHDLNLVKLPSSRSIALAARTGKVPIALSNESGRRALVRIRVTSEKLTFPGGSERTVSLDRKITLTDFEVRVRASGTLPMRVQLLTPDGSIELGRSDGVSIRSSAIPPVGVALGGSALLVLIAWWARSMRSSRRARPGVGPEDRPPRQAERRRGRTRVTDDPGRKQRGPAHRAKPH